MWRPPGRATPDGPPNIARVLDAGATDTVRGVRITDFCDEHKLSPDQRLRLFIQVCQAIQHAHQQGVVHRDVKPSNILVSLNAGVPKVIDFGIAKATQGRLTDQTLFTAFEQFIDTPAYLSPEQALMPSLDIDTRTDIYSLGDLPDDQRRHAEAESQLRSALERRRRLQGDPHKDTLTCTVMLINNLLAAERYGDAERLARDCLNTRERVMPDHVRTFNARSVLGASVLRIVQLYEPTQRPELATEWNKRLVPAPAVKE